MYCFTRKMGFPTRMSISIRKSVNFNCPSLHLCCSDHAQLFIMSPYHPLIEIDPEGEDFNYIGSSAVWLWEVLSRSWCLSCPELTSTLWPPISTGLRTRGGTLYPFMMRTRPSQHIPHQLASIRISPKRLWTSIESKVPMPPRFKQACIPFQEAAFKYSSKEVVRRTWTYLPHPASVWTQNRLSDADHCCSVCCPRSRRNGC